MQSRFWRSSAGFFAIFFLLGPFRPLCAHGQQQSAAETSAGMARAVGTIKNIQPKSLLVTSDSGGQVTLKLSRSTRILRVSPGEKDLKNATPLEVEDLQPGDRVLARGEATTDSHSIAASTVIVMKEAEISAKQERDLEEWQRRGVGGLVSSVDAASGAATISVGGLGKVRNIIVHRTQDTVVRRYAADSVKFDDAKPSSFDQIKPGDQLRARGKRSDDQGELIADEIVFGTFRNIAGTISGLDPAANTMTVEDMISRSAVVVKIAPDSQMKKLPQEMAQRIALRLKGGGDGGDRQSGARNFKTPAAPDSAQIPRPLEGGMQTERGSGRPDFQRLIGRLPSSTLADLQKGDAVMLVSTMPASSGAVTAITLLAGVEAIMTSAPSRTASLMLSPWTLGPSSAESGAAEP